MCQDKLTHSAEGSLADAPKEPVAILALGTDAGIGTQFAVGHAGQAGVACPLRVGATRAVGPAVTLVKETLQAFLICREEGEILITLH